MNKYEDEGKGSLKQIPAQISNLHGLLIELEEGVISLEQELRPIKRTDLVKEEKDEEPVQELVPLATQLRENCNRTKSIIELIKDIHQGLQI